jgi:hypothetical protein
VKSTSYCFPDGSDKLTLPDYRNLQPCPKQTSYAHAPEGDVSLQEYPNLRAWIKRFEAIAIFAPIAVAVQALGLTNETTALGAQIFMASRVIHAIVFVVGILWVRTTAWTGGVIGSVMVATPLLG